MPPPEKEECDPPVVGTGTGPGLHDEEGGDKEEEGLLPPGTEPGPVMDTRPSPPEDEVDDEAGMKIVLLENQVAMLRRANESLVQRLESYDQHTEIVTLQKTNDALTKTLQSALKLAAARPQEPVVAPQVDKEVVPLKKEIANLNAKLKLKILREQFKDEEILKLRKEVGSLKTQLQDEEVTVKLKKLRDEKKDEEIKKLKQKILSEERKVSHAEKLCSKLQSEKATLRDKVENQKKNLTGLEQQLILMKSEALRSTSCPVVKDVPRTTTCAQCAIKVPLLDASLAKYRERIKNQAETLTNLNAALSRAKEELGAQKYIASRVKNHSYKSSHQVQCPGLTELKVNNVAIPDKQDGPRRSPSDADTFAFEKVVLKILCDNFIMARNVKQSFEEMEDTMPTLRPSFRAVIAAMPPATRVFCMESVMLQLPPPPALLASCKLRAACCKLWINDPSLKGSDAARMAVFWGRLTALEIASSSGKAKTAPGSSLWQHPLPEKTGGKAAHMNMLRSRVAGRDPAQGSSSRHQPSLEKRESKLSAIATKEQYGSDDDSSSFEREKLVKQRKDSSSDSVSDQSFEDVYVPKPPTTDVFGPKPLPSSEVYGPMPPPSSEVFGPMPPPSSEVFGPMPPPSSEVFGPMPPSSWDSSRVFGPVPPPESNPGPIAQTRVHSCAHPLVPPMCLAPRSKRKLSPVWCEDDPQEAQSRTRQRAPMSAAIHDVIKRRILSHLQPNSASRTLPSAETSSASRMACASETDSA